MLCSNLKNEAGCLYKCHHTQKGSGVYDRVVNKIFGSNLKDGEIHAVLKTPDGFKAASYIGPGTHIVDNIKEGKEPISEVDRVAMGHDLRYLLAKNAADVRKADERMMSVLDRLQKEKKDHLFNIYTGKIPIKAKMMAEDLGLIKKGSFANIDYQDTLSKEDLQMAKDKLAELEQSGYGRSSNFFPSSYLRA